MSKDTAPTTDNPPAPQPTAEEKQARKAQQAIDGAAAWAEYKDGEAATRARTAELRAERLAREAREAKQTQQETPAKGKKKG